MLQLHPDSPAVDRVGPKLIRAHFDITSAAVSQWKRRGVPKNCRRPLALLGKLLGHEMPELPAPELPNVG